MIFTFLIGSQLLLISECVEPVAIAVRTGNVEGNSFTKILKIVEKTPNFEH